MTRNDINNLFSNLRSDNLDYRSLPAAKEADSIPRHDASYCDQVRTEQRRLPDLLLALVPEPIFVKGRIGGGILQADLLRAVKARGFPQISEKEMVTALEELKRDRKVKFSKRKDGKFWIRGR